jgi:hypothetical protein
MSRGPGGLSNPGRITATITQVRGQSSAAGTHPGSAPTGWRSLAEIPGVTSGGTARAGAAEPSWLVRVGYFDGCGVVHLIFGVDADS